MDPLLRYLNAVSKAIKSSLNSNEILHSVIFVENALTAESFGHHLDIYVENLYLFSPKSISCEIHLTHSLPQIKAIFATVLPISLSLSFFFFFGVLSVV